MTNVPGPHGIQKSDLLKALSKTVAESVGRPEQVVMISLTTDKPMLYGGTDAPCAYGELISIGGIGGDKNKVISAAISTVLNTKLGVSPSRFYLKFVDTPGSDLGWNGTTGGPVPPPHPK